MPAHWSPARPGGSPRHALGSRRARTGSSTTRGRPTLAGADGFEALAAREPDGVQNAFLPVRTRFFDDLLTGAGSTAARQVVLLGAGLDTRAYRLDLIPGTTLYELDHPEVLAAKATVLRGAVPRCDRRPVPVDLRADWTRPLLTAGFDPATPTTWLAEGLLFHLGAREVEALLRTAAALSAGDAVFGADTFGTGLLRLPAMRALVEHRTATGVPLPFCTDDPHRLLSDAGWQPRDVVDVGQPRANFGRLSAVPEPWDGGADPTTRSYLLVGTRRVGSG